MTESQQNLSISRIDLQKVADFLPYPFIIAEIFDGKHQNTHLNIKFKEEIGYDLSEIPTIEDWYEKAYPNEEYRSKVISRWNIAEGNTFNSGKVFVKMKSQVTRKDGSTQWYEISATVIRAIHVVAFVNLEKEIALQEELKNINRNNDRMLSILGHDLRSPIANLMSISSLALNTDISNDEFVEMTQMVNEQSTSVLELLDNTMNWAKINFNTIAIVPTDIDLYQMLSGILSVYKVICDSKNISVTIDCSAMQTVKSDLEILTVIVRNIISNALKFTPTNGTISITSKDNRIVIKDSGVGMSQFLIDAILNHNYTSRTGTHEEKGSGLGLQLVIDLVKKIDCQLLIESKEFSYTEVAIVF